MFFELVVGFSVAVTLWELLLDSRQYGVVKRAVGVPDEVAPYLSHSDAGEALEKSRAYQLDKLSFAMWTSVPQLLLSVAGLVLLPTMWAAAHIVQAALPEALSGELVLSLLFYTLSEVVNMLAGLPFSAYRVFVLEERHGFNTQTVRGFLRDAVLGLAVNIPLSCVLLSGLLWCVWWGGDRFVLYAWALVLVFSLFMLAIYPVWIAPLFNTFTPLAEGELRTAVEALAAKLSFPLTELYEIDGSKRSSHSNAYFYGFWRSKRIVLFDTLIKQADTDGIVAILAHELGHWKLSHTLKGFVLSQVQILVFFSLYHRMATSDAMYASFGFPHERPVIVGFLLFAAVYGPLSQLWALLANVVSRRFEYEADAFAAGELGMALEAPLVAIHEKNAGSWVNDAWYSAYHHSHPTIVERLQAIAKLKQKRE